MIAAVAVWYKISNNIKRHGSGYWIDLLFGR